MRDHADWPADLAQRYRREGYWQDVTLGWALGDWARAHGARTALVAGQTRWSYTELDTRADRLAAGLHRLGLRAGERVVVQLPNIPDFLALSFALFRLGVAPVYALPAHRASEIAHLCDLTDAAGYVVPAARDGFDYRALATGIRSTRPGLRHVLLAGGGRSTQGFVALEDLLDPAEPPAMPPPDPADIAFFLLSGGTTGTPKLIGRTHRDYVYNLRASAEVCRLDSASVYLVALPIAHNFPLGCPGVLGTLHAGGTVILAPDPSPDTAFGLIERERVTVTAVVPALAQVWVEAAAWATEDLSSLALLQVGGAKLEEATAGRIPPALGCALQQVFGMAEGLLCYTRLEDPEHVVFGTQGRPLATADEIRVVGVDGQPVEPGAVGELLTRGPYTLRGYYRAAEYNRTAFTPDGFLRTGDLVRITPAGHLVVTGRVKDVVNRGGDKVPAGEVETHLRSHSGVRDAAVVGVPDPLLGERSCAFVVPRDPQAPPTLPELTAFLRHRGLAAYKLPDRLEVLGALPRTGVGKVDKPALGARATRR